jgi:hypothetical protein
VLVGSMDQFLMWAAHAARAFRSLLPNLAVGRLFRPRKRLTPAAPPILPAHVGRVPCFSMPVAAAFGFLVLAQTAWFVPTKFDTRSDSELVERAQSLPFEKIAAGCSGWKMTGIETPPPRDRSSPFGKYSVLAAYEVEDQIAKLEIDFPFFGWHNLTNCYALRGWDVRSTKVLDTLLPGQQPGDTVEQFLTRGVDEQAYLLYSMHDSGGRILKRPGKYPDWRWLQAHLLSPRGLNIHLCSLFRIDISEQQVFSAEPEWYMPTLQFQVMVQGLKPPSEEQKEQARTNFDQVRNLLFQNLSRTPENKP